MHSGEFAPHTLTAHASPPTPSDPLRGPPPPPRTSVEGEAWVLPHQCLFHDNDVLWTQGLPLRQPTPTYMSGTRDDRKGRPYANAKPLPLRTVGRWACRRPDFDRPGQNRIAARQSTSGLIVLRTMGIPLTAKFPVGASPPPYGWMFKTSRELPRNIHRKNRILRESCHCEGRSPVAIRSPKPYGFGRTTTKMATFWGCGLPRRALPSSQ